MGRLSNSTRRAGGSVARAYLAGPTKREAHHANDKHTEGVHGRTGGTEIADDEGVRALFKDTEGDPVGFVLTGTKLSEKNTLAKELPSLMS